MRIIAKEYILLNKKTDVYGNSGVCQDFYLRQKRKELWNN